MNRETKFDTEARNGLQEGINELANAVKITLGPNGRYVIMYSPYKGIHSTKDGATVAENIFPENEHRSMGAEMVREVAQNTAELAGDGTTTATVLAQSMITQGLKLIDMGANPIDIKKGMVLAKNQLVTLLKEKSELIDGDNSKIKQVASISANNDEEIGALLANAFSEVGDEGKITIEEAKGTDTYYEVVKGMQFDRGYLSPYLVTNSDEMQILYDNINIVVCEDKIQNGDDVNSLLDLASETKEAYLLICDDMTKEALASIVLNKLRNKLKIAVIKAPYIGIKRKQTLMDISLLTGAHVMSKENGYPISKLKSNLVGSAEKLIVTKTNTLIVNGHGNNDKIQNHVSTLKDTIETLPTKYEKERLEERIARLTSGVAVVYVGATTEVEMKEKKDRVDDAKLATDSAIEEGIVPGGGITLLKLSKKIDINVENKDKMLGVDIVLKACEEPIRTISDNSQLPADIIINEVINNSDFEYGFDFKSQKYVNMIEKGIIDPTKVTRVALENAVSIASVMIMTGCALINIGEEDKGLPQYTL